MRVRGDLPPSNAFSLEEQPKHPGYVLARFYENVEPFEDTSGDVTIKGYVYDEYHLELKDYDGLADDILNSFGGYLTQAKLAEAEEKIIPQLREQVDDLETEKGNMSTRITELSEQVAEQDDALIELYEMIGG